MIRSAPQPGDIGLTSVDGPVGWGIRLGQLLLGDGATPYEHAFLVLNGGELIEAQPGGAVVRPLSEYDGRHVLYVCPPGLVPARRWAICDEARKYAGVPYSFLDFAALAAHRFRFPVPGLRRFVASTQHQICSQLVDQVYQDAGVRLFDDGRWPGYISPADLFHLLGSEEAPR